jgi:hypothetical protein
VRRGSIAVSNSAMSTGDKSDLLQQLSIVRREEAELLQHVKASATLCTSVSKSSTGRHVTRASLSTRR